MKNTNINDDEIIVTISKSKFDKLPSYKKRVLVAQDVIDRINFGQIKPYNGSFCKNFIEDDETEKLTQLSEKLKRSNMSCYACAKGALFLSFIGIVNDYSIDTTKSVVIHDGQYNDSKEMGLLSEIFPLKQLSLIETTFERYNYSWNEIISIEEKNKCYDFHDKYHTSTDRVIAICKNIIKNKGNFIP